MNTSNTYTRATLALEIALKTSADCARAYAHAAIERHTPYESPSLFSDLAYRDARGAARLARLIDDSGFGFILSR